MANGDRDSDRREDRSGEERPAESAGLCARCACVRIQGTKRGARFYRCARADEDEAFPRYPPLPVLRCSGFEPMAD